MHTTALLESVVLQLDTIIKFHIIISADVHYPPKMLSIKKLKLGQLGHRKHKMFCPWPNIIYLFLLKSEDKNGVTCMFSEWMEGKFK